MALPLRLVEAFSPDFDPTPAQLSKLVRELRGSIKREKIMIILRNARRRGLPPPPLPVPPINFESFVLALGCGFLFHLGLLILSVFNKRKEMNWGDAYWRSRA
jgi:hypothetical protein